VTNESSLHPGVAVIPAALALAQEAGAHPVRFLEAVVCGYEIAIRAGNALNAPSAYRRGFHPTGVAGAFGAAAAGAKVLGLDAERTARALGIAGTMASGSLEYLSDGSWTKRITAGWAAHAGVVAARLARAGVSGPATVFEGPRGFLRQYSDDPAPERLLAALGDPLMVMTVSLKPYGCCRYNHGLIDCALELRDRVRVAEIARIRLGVLDAGALLVSRPIERKREPRNVVDAQFSAPFAVAIALARGAAGAAQYTEEALADPLVRELMRRTDCLSDPALDGRYPREWGAWVELVLRDGRTLRAEVDDPLGGPAHPLAREALVARFRDLTGLGDDVARRVLGLADERDLSFVV
jgi:2-methylcitrate dehydratase PrpD